MNRRRGLALMLLLAACGGRSPTIVADGAPSDGVTPGFDAGIEWSHPPPDRGRPESCVRPPGGCFSSEDCPKGHECQGCGGDPCCPACAVCYGRCEPATVSTCKSNSECKPQQLCNLDFVCQVTGGKAGTCEPRPTGCYEIYAPVCGCDGKTYGNDCEAHSVGVSVKQKGACAQTCQDLEQAYLSTIKAAKTCCPTCKSIQCQKKIKSALACPCETYVHDLNSAAIQLLTTLEAQWGALGCSAGIACPPMPCPAVNGATCQGTGSIGSCQDVFF